MNASLLYPSHCILGEGPLWHPEKKCCFWVDIENDLLYEYNWISKATRSWNINYKPSMVVQGKTNDLILALQGGIARFYPDAGTLEWLIEIEKEKTENRCNDGRCDSSGRLWVGTMHKDHHKGAGSLYCIDKDLKIQKKIDHVTISNGLAWTLDNKRLYYIDSPTQTVQSYLYNETNAEITFEKVVIRVPEEMGTPDGMTIDTEGMLWIAHWGGFGVYRWNPFTGKLINKVNLPVPNVSSCTFAGEDFDHLVITTASQNLSEDQLIQYPDSGNIFVVKTEVQGMASYKSIF